MSWLRLAPLLTAGLVFACAAPQRQTASAAAVPVGCKEKPGRPSVKSFGQFPHYTKEARDKHVAGTLIVTVDVDAAGNVSGASLERSLGAGLDEAVLASVRSMQFYPAKQCGVPVPGEFRLRYRFQ